MITVIQKERKEKKNRPIYIQIEQRDAYDKDEAKENYESEWTIMNIMKKKNQFTSFEKMKWIS